MPTKKRYAPSPKKGEQAKTRAPNSSHSSRDQEPAAQIKHSSDPDEDSSDPNEDFKLTSQAPQHFELAESRNTPNITLQIKKMIFWVIRRTMN